MVSYTPKSQILMNGNLLDAILQDLGIGLVGLSQVERFIKTGELFESLPEFRMTYEPFYAYYPSRKHHSKAFEVVLNALRE